MTNVLVECSDMIASVKLGVLQCLKSFENDCKCCVMFKRTIDIRACDIRWCDILITVRGCERITLKIVERAKKFNRFVVYYLDDDLLNVPISVSCPQFYFEQVIKKNLISVISQCDALWCVNDKICYKYSEYIKSKRAFMNKVPMEVVNKGMNLPQGVVRVLYAGSVSHTEMVQEVLSPVVRSIAEKYLDNVEFCFLGADSGIRDLKNVKNIHIISDYEKYRSYVENGKFSIGLAVVRNEEFYKCKYYNKFLEYSSIGCVGIYTNSEPYTFVVKNGVNGILSYNSFSDWYNSIEFAINNIKTCERMCIEAQKCMREEHNHTIVEHRLSIDFPELISYSAPKIGKLRFVISSPKTTYYLSRLDEIFESYGVINGFSFILKKLISKINLRRKESAND